MITTPPETVWRFPLPITERATLQMPRAAKILAVGPHRQPAGYDVYLVDPPLDLWAIVDPTAEPEQRTLFVVGTGNPMPRDAGRYVGTTHSHDRTGIWHVFEAAPPAGDGA